jgi:SAM-dependent methyltransferase
VPGQPVSPLSGRAPDRLLFSTRDTNGGNGNGSYAGGPGEGADSIHYVYYDSAGDAALAYPPVSLTHPEPTGAADATSTPDAVRAVMPPDPAACSPYAGYRGGGGLGHLLARVPSPYWWFSKPNFADPLGPDVSRLLAGLVDERDADVRLLNVSCFEGDLLDGFKARTRWQLCGTETNARAAAAARAKGHEVWEVSAQDAAMALPVGRAFDVICLGRVLEHLENPLMVLRRLRPLLEPGGLIVINQPNLDSKHAELFGPTWAHWQIPRHRTLTGRRGVRRMAAMAGLRVVRLRTRTHPYPACHSAQLNELGLGAVVPDDARFPNEIASRGVRLTGWSRLLWDWRGRGDYLYAALRAE